MSDSFTGQQINASVIRLTAAQWTAQPYVLPAGVIGLESDTGAFKIGDGETAWADLLAYSTPTGVKTYRALLTQTGTDAPVATVLENTLGGTVVWTRDGTGTYLATLANAFTADKTLVYVSSVGGNANDVVFPQGQWSSTNVVSVNLIMWHWEDPATSAMFALDLSEVANSIPGASSISVEILVYP